MIYLHIIHIPEAGGERDPLSAAVVCALHYSLMYRPMVASDVMAVKATVEPSMGRPRMKAASTISHVDTTGVVEILLTLATHLPQNKLAAGQAKSAPQGMHLPRRRTCSALYTWHGYALNCRTRTRQLYMNQFTASHQRSLGALQTQPGAL